MGGIAKINKGREDLRQPQVERPSTREVWMKDGDQIFATAIATGAENDPNLDDVYLYTFRIGNNWTNLIKDPSVDASSVPEDTYASHKFAFWAYVHNIIHTRKDSNGRIIPGSEDWVEIEGPSGKKIFREDVNDFKVISFGFGRGDANWNQLVDLYNDWGSLDKGVMRLKRTGTGMLDTSYQIVATAKTEEVPADRKVEIAELQKIKDYYMERYGNSIPTSDAPTANDAETTLF